MSAKKQGKGTSVIFTPDGGSAWVGVFGANVNETGRAAAPVDANEIDSDYQETDANEVPNLGSIEFTVFHDPENPFPVEGTKGVLRVEDPITNSANATKAFRQGDAYVEENNVERDLNNKMIATIKVTFNGKNYTSGNEAL